MAHSVVTRCEKPLAHWPCPATELRLCMAAAGMGLADTEPNKAVG